MYKISCADAKNLREEMIKTKKATIYKKLQAVALRGEGLKNAEIATITGYSSNYIVELCKSYILNGFKGLTTDGRKGGNNRNLTTTAEEDFLSKFEKAAANGQIITISEIVAAYDELTGKERESKSTVYYLLQKHGWRVITPQRVHPGKASDEVIETSKKLT